MCFLVPFRDDALFFPGMSLFSPQSGFCARISGKHTGVKVYATAMNGVAADCVIDVRTLFGLTPSDQKPHPDHQWSAAVDEMLTHSRP
jgi:hypothetical protein